MDRVGQEFDPRAFDQRLLMTIEEYELTPAGLSCGRVYPYRRTGKHRKRLAAADRYRAEEARELQELRDEGSSENEARVEYYCRRGVNYIVE
jgi:hypothetical protein